MGSETAGEAGKANGPFGQLVIQALHRLGVRHFFVSPGSRSTPLTTALQDLPEEDVTVVLDERSAAFQAIGRIKASAHPVAVVCTSGSAAAHYFPALIEAREAGLPLVVLTADRPHELRHCHAGQTIDQVKMFGTYPVFQAELPLPAVDSLLLRQTREICRGAVEAAVGIPGGPVHLNFPFREPFFPEDGVVPLVDQTLLKGLSLVQPNQGRSLVDPQLPERTIILAGPRPTLDPPCELEAVLELSRRRGFPILVDGCNPLRYRADSGALVVHYDRIARDDAIWAKLQPEAVVLWGEPPTSKLLRQRLADLDLPGYLVCGSKRTMNPIHGQLEWAGSSMEQFLMLCNGPMGAYAADWEFEDDKLETALKSLLKVDHTLFEGDVHRMLASSLPDAAPVFYASSLAIRGAEWFMPKLSSGLRPFCQRGANGIDGTVSLARGIANGLGEPTWLVTGDLAFLHDSNGLTGGFSRGAGLFIVLLNNNGGGIFEFLPIASESTSFERLFATPQDVDIAQLVSAHGGKHLACSSLGELGKAVEEWDGSGLVVAEIQIDRKSSKALHRRHLMMQHH